MSSSEPAADPTARAASKTTGLLRRLFTKPGLIQALFALVLLMVVPEVYPPLFEELKLKGFDIEERLVPRALSDQQVMIVAVDEASLAKPYGQWPWPRSQVAALVQKIAKGKPSALAVDIIFAEPDRFSPETYAAMPGIPSSLSQALQGLSSNEATLATAFKSVPTVLGMGAVAEAAASGTTRFSPTPVLQVGGDAAKYLQSFPALLRSLPEITAAETGRALLAGNPDPDGILRRVPLAAVVNGNIIPGLALETLRVAVPARAITVFAEPGGIEGIGTAGVVFPTDGQGRAYPYFAPAGSTDTVSAADVLSDKVDPAVFQGKAVMLGVTGLGLVDLKETPLGLMQGIEVQAQLLISMLSGELLHRPLEVPRLETFILLLVGLVVIFTLPYSRTVLAGTLLGVILVICLGGEFLAFAAGRTLLDGIYPSISAVITFGVMLFANNRAAEAQRQRLGAELEREREQKARLEGELGAARAIQMGLLPRPLPRIPETSSVDIHALIETARMVGGDLYDFVMLDPKHLFFAIADVSGKGVDAALFMAMTKMVFGGATVQFGEALDRVFADANAKIALASDQTRAEGGRPMFVTVFAAVLELETGLIFFASAGHDSPYLLRDGSTPLRLETEGGPPLGTLDEFPFPVDHGKLEPGDLLLLYTDGVTEAKDEAGGFYTSARLDHLLTTTEARTARAVVEHVRADVRQFVGGAEQADDITLLGVRWLGPDAPFTAP